MVRKLDDRKASQNLNSDRYTYIYTSKENDQYRCANSIFLRSIATDAVNNSHGERLSRHSNVEGLSNGSVAPEPSSLSGSTFWRMFVLNVWFHILTVSGDGFRLLSMYAKLLFSGSASFFIPVSSNKIGFLRRERLAELSTVLLYDTLRRPYILVDDYHV